MFDNDLLRIVRLFASCINNAFSMGAAECKLSMDGMTTYECVRYMRALKGEVIKNPYQILSAAWNLNGALTDDINLEEPSLTRKTVPTKLTDKFEIAKNAILFTKLGGFDKSTWDGKFLLIYKLSLIIKIIKKFQRC